MKSDSDGQAVAGGFVERLPGEHVGGHVGQDHAAGGDLVLAQVGVAQVVRDGLVPVVRLRTGGGPGWSRGTGTPSLP